MKYKVHDKLTGKTYSENHTAFFWMFALTMNGTLGIWNEELQKYETCDPERYTVEVSE
jgi:hypothetical protein